MSCVEADQGTVPDCVRGLDDDFEPDGNPNESLMERAKGILPPGAVGSGCAVEGTGGGQVVAGTWPNERTRDGGLLRSTVLLCTTKPEPFDVTARLGGEYAAAEGRLLGLNTAERVEAQGERSTRRSVPGLPGPPHVEERQQGSHRVVLRCGCRKLTDAVGALVTQAEHDSDCGAVSRPRR